MPVFLTRSECRRGFFHVVTYDISSPDNWIEIEDLLTEQPCRQQPQILAVADVASVRARKAYTTLIRNAYKRALSRKRPDPLIRSITVGQVTPKGRATSLEVLPNGTSILSKGGRKGQAAGRTCSGSCDGVPVGPLNCPAPLQPVLDCTVNPPRLSCR